VVPLTDLLIVVRRTLEEWSRIRWSDLHFAQAQPALLLLVVLVAVALAMLLIRSRRSRQPGAKHVVLPAILPGMRRSPLAATRHAAFLLFLIGIPFFAVALGDPRTSFTREDVSNPGRRIALLIDGSGSMIINFETTKLGAQDQRAFYTGVAAAERFLKMRMDGPYRDLVALIEFGNEAWVVTPFTTDYENVRLSLKLIGNPKAYGRFNDVGTTIIKAFEQSTQLFKTFNYMKASGNLILIFTDAGDAETLFRGQTLNDIVGEARESEIPVYMFRIGYNTPEGKNPNDATWKPAVERTGGRFYAITDEQTLLRAIAEVDRLNAGTIEQRHYSSERPRFSGYALVAVGLWVLAAALKLGFRSFQTFP
jgi:hypothetical protein